MKGLCPGLAGREVTSECTKRQGSRGSAFLPEQGLSEGSVLPGQGPRAPLMTLWVVKLGERCYCPRG